MSIHLKRKIIVIAAAIAFTCMCLISPMFRAYALESMYTKEIPVKVTLNKGSERSEDNEDQEDKEDSASEDDDKKPIFQFKIAADEEGSPMPENAVISITGEGEGKFIIPYSPEQVGTYTYTITAVKGAQKDLIYSNEVYKVKLQIMDDNGLQANIFIREKSSDKKTDAAEFSHSVKSTGKSSPNKNPGGGAKGSGSVKTGDRARVSLVFAICVSSILIMGLCMLWRKCSHSDEENSN